MSKSTGMIIVTRVFSGRGDKSKTTFQDTVIRAADIVRIQPIDSLAEPDAHALVETANDAYWVKQSPAEVRALVNERADKEQDLQKRQVAALEAIVLHLAAWRDTNFGRGI